MPPFAARLWPDKPPTNLLTPSPQIKGKAVTVSSQLLRSLRLLHNCQLTVLVYPPPPPGAIIAREPQCRCERRCPESAYINIIPSGLCNSRRHRQCPASKESVKHTPGARWTVLPGVRLHNPDYVKYAPSVSWQASYLRTPGRGGGRRAAPFKDLRPPGPSGGRALCARSIHRHRDASPAPAVVSSASSGDHCVRSFLRIISREVFEGAKCHHAEPLCNAHNISRIQRQCGASILPP